LVKLLNGKGASTILVINHDGKRMVVMKDERKANALHHEHSFSIMIDD